MEKNSVFPMLLVAGIVIAFFVIWQKRQATAAAMAVQPTGYAAAVDTVNDKVTAVLSKVPGGKYLNNAITKPISNVTSGNWKATFGSAATGGLSDFSSKLNPFNW